MRNKRELVILGFVFLFFSMVFVTASDQIYSSNLRQEVTLNSGFPWNGAVSLAFDDGLATQYSYAWPLMQERGMVGTFYVVTRDLGLRGITTVDQLRDLQAHGNEIASHSDSHIYFDNLTEQEIRYECEISKSVLQGYGLTVTDFAYPFGSGNSTADSIVNQYYRSARYDWGIMGLPHMEFQVKGWTSYNDTDVGDFDVYRQVIDSVYDQKGWCILYFHSIVPDYSTGALVSTEAFADILDYVASKGVEVLTVEQALGIQGAERNLVEVYSDANLTERLGNNMLVDWGLKHSGTSYNSVWVKNVANGSVILDLIVESLPDGWNCTWNYSGNPIPAGSTVEIIIKLDTASVEGLYDFGIKISAYTQST